MSLLRFSQVADGLYRTEPDGRLDLSSGAGNRLQIVRPGVQGAPPAALTDYINAALVPVPPGRPIVIMVHGFDFNPLDDPEADPAASENPHARLFHFGPDDRAARAVSWPIRFGFNAPDAPDEGLALAFGWDSNTSPYHLDAYERGTRAAWGLIAILAALHTLDPGRRVQLVAHSLGTHVVLHMLNVLASNEFIRDNIVAVERVVLMGGSEFVLHARRTYRRLEVVDNGAGGKLLDGLRIYNLVSREDEVVSVISGIVTYGPLGTEKHMIGYHGLQRGRRPKNWIDLNLTDGQTRNRVRDAFDGLQVSGDAPNDWLDHWHFFVHEDNTQFIRFILTHDDRTDIDTLRDAGIGGRVAQLPKSETSWAYDSP